MLPVDWYQAWQNENLFVVSGKIMSALSDSQAGYCAAIVLLRRRLPGKEVCQCLFDKLQELFPF
jgi:hypothetical protein